MNKKEEAIAKDNMIRFMLENPQFQNKFGLMDRTFSCSDFRKDVFNKKISNQYIERLIREIIDYPEEIVSNSYDLNIEINDITQRFIDEGGFLGEYEQKTKAIRDYNIATIAEKKDKKNQYVVNKWKAKLAPWQYWTFWPVFVFGAVGGIYALIQIFSNSDNISQERLEIEMEALRNEVQQLENDLKESKETIIMDSVKTKDAIK